jgi:hypothetical protein
VIEKLQSKLDALNVKCKKSGLSSKEECEHLDLIDDIREFKNIQNKKEPEFRLTGEF